MTAVALPDVPWLADVEPQYVDFGGNLQPLLGGPTQRISRLGSRYAVTVTLPPLDEDQARDWVAARLDAAANRATLIMAFPQAPDPGNLGGAPVVSGGGQGGSTLNVSGLRARARVRKLSFFSFAASGRNYLHATTRIADADGSGNIALPISPILRLPPANGAALEFYKPQIEGFVDGTTISWKVDVLKTYGITFTLREVE